MLETAWQDARHGARMLAKNPGFSLVAVLSIAIGVGANTAMFSVADGLIFRPLGVPEASGLVTLNEIMPTGEVRNGGISYPDYLDIRDRSRSFEGLIAFRGMLASFAGTRGEQAQGRYGLAVTGNFFDVLRVRPVLGRGFVSDEDRVPGRDAVVVLAHESWTEQFGADPAILGRSIRVGGRDFAVVGVAPERFTGVDLYLPPAFYVPLAMLPAIDGGEVGILERRDVRRLDVLGRLRPGVSLAQASQEVRLFAAALEQTHPDTNRQHGMLARTETEARFEEYAPMHSLGVMLLGLALAVLLVACANVAGLLASRAPVRARELAVRLAVGGSRGRLVRQLMTESTLIAAAGGAAGLALAYGGIRSFQQFQVPSDVGIRLTYELDRRALVVGFVVAALSALLSSVIPAWRSSRALDLSSTLRNATKASVVPRLWGRHGLVATQIGLTLVMLTVAVSFYRAFEAEYGRGPGFRTDHLLLATVDPGLAKYDARRTEDFYRQLETRVSAIPGVTSVATSSFVPLSQGTAPVTIVPEGYELPPNIASLSVVAARVDEDYLDAIGIPLVQGRQFDRRDAADAPPVAIVSRGMANRYWPGEDPLGKRIRLTAANEWVVIVGVAADAKFRLFTPASTPFLYLPRQQSPVARSTLLVRTAGDSAAVAAPVRAAIAEIDREMPVLLLRTMEDFYYASARNLNVVVVRTVAGMGAMGLALALIGLYGLMAYAVSRRTREIGIRMAVGARPQSVLGMILRQGCAPSALGVALGVVASVGVGGLLRSAFAGTGGDAVTYLLVVPGVVLVVMLAAYVPARRAAAIDPLVALRQD
jgi:predicted permease